MAYDEILAGRVRRYLHAVAEPAEQKMFGGLVFITGGHLTVGVYGDGLIARIGTADMAGAVAEPGVRPFSMAGRSMRGIVIVAGDVLDDERLEHWIGRARAHVAALPAK